MDGGYASLQKAVLAIVGVAMLSLFIWSGAQPDRGFEPLEAAAMVLVVGSFFFYRLLEDVLSTRQEGLGLILLTLLSTGVVVAFPEVSIDELDGEYYLALAAAIALGLGMVFQQSLTE